MTSSGLRCPSAISIAERTNSVRRCEAIAQPTTVRLNASTTTDRYKKPEAVGTYVMSATHSSSGPLASKSRFTRSAAGAARSLRVVVATPSSAHALQACFAHQASDAFASHASAPIAQFGVDTRRAVGAARALVDGTDLFDQHRVLSLSPRGGSFAPRVVAAGGDAQHSAHGGNGEFGLVRFYEREDLPGTSPVSRANQAAAFAKISRSCLRQRNSLRSWRSSSRSAAVVPSDRTPSSRSAFLI